MTDKEKRQFIKKHKSVLKEIFRDWLEQMRQDAAMMPRGDERDLRLDLANEFQYYWLPKFEFKDKENNVEKFPGV